MFVKHNIPKKMKDPNNFNILCLIGRVDVGHALCDLGANFNLMPVSIFKKLGIGEGQPTIVSLQLDDCSITYLEGKIDNVLV